MEEWRAQRLSQRASDSSDALNHPGEEQPEPPTASGIDDPVAPSGADGPADYGSDGQRTSRLAASAAGAKATKPRGRAKRRSGETEGHNP
ncbi:hypothetical protein, partial [Nonomuraea wenchangensis]|uniref:hypothetical protein n=1 Tax=Nonomuraea wenchangensis TaxID=568860 RepID=UPI003327B9CD